MRPSDSIADLLTRIRNAAAMQHKYVDIPLSKLKLSIVQILKEEGFIVDFATRQDAKQGTIRVFIKYTKDRNAVIQGIKRLSKPSVRHYVAHDEIPKVLGGMGTTILSTSKGVMSGKQAKKEKVGGELLCSVW